MFAVVDVFEFMQLGVWKHAGRAGLRSGACQGDIARVFSSGINFQLINAWLGIRGVADGEADALRCYRREPLDVSPGVNRSAQEATRGGRGSARLFQNGSGPRDC